MDEACRAYADAVAGVLGEALGPALVGVYLHGSAAAGDYDPSRSDIDILAVCAGPLSAGERARLGAGLGRDALPCPADAGLEFSLVTRAAARDPTRAPAYELHGWDEHGRLRPGDDRGDPDLPLHFAVARQIGIAVVGRRWPTSCATSRETSRSGWSRTSSTGRSQTQAASTQVLTACRAWALSVDGLFRSKRAAAEWALGRGAPPVVAEVLADHRAARGSSPDPETVAEFVASVGARVQHK